MIVATLKLVFNICLSTLSFLIPKSNKYIIVGGWEGKRYSDNSRAIFEYLTEHQETLGLKRVFWYTNSLEIYQSLSSKGYHVLMGLNLKSAFWHLRSKVHFIDQNPRDILGYLSVRAHRINLWHGVPLKKIGIDIVENYKPQPRWWKKWTSAGFWVDQYLVATSPLAAELLTHAMDLPAEKALLASYPRNAVLLKEKGKQLGQNRRVYYLPTFRNDGQRNPILNEDLSSLNELLTENRIELSIKPHFASLADWKLADDLSNIHVLEAKEDVYEGLQTTDILITDYSSVFFDFLLTGRPILFFPYDYENYKNDERGFTMPYNENTPGKKVYTYQDLLKSLLEISQDPDSYRTSYQSQYEEVCKKVHQFVEEPNYDSILKFIK
ncbi:CDP-glycerol glycerophosphotransferase family protein [Streptococcus oricebi]|uniref:CDP-glycerol:poly(Glycerophosphate) glycerophosphotransferase n=1 Tax=Streptococcus oricebi TaxID=1547447 RepID=A0ABS5B554_9STRE|nr:CDP-glycerol glycerophosphotransferase family protein [Streptococcus oricebi]MBP2623964.1 hypothetical protein [Streptococcus oricebi]